MSDAPNLGAAWMERYDRAHEVEVQARALMQEVLRQAHLLGGEPFATLRRIRDHRDIPWRRVHCAWPSVMRVCFDGGQAVYHFGGPDWHVLGIGEAHVLLTNGDTYGHLLRRQLRREDPMVIT